MGRRNRECYLCGTKYKYCPTCYADRMKPAFMAQFHDENCQTIWDICTRFNMKMMSKEEAMEAIAKCDLSNQQNFKQYVQRDIANIMAEEPKPKRGKRAEIKSIIDEAVEPVLIHEVVTQTEE